MLKNVKLVDEKTELTKFLMKELTGLLLWLLNMEKPWSDFLSLAIRKRN